MEEQAICIFCLSPFARTNKRKKYCSYHCAVSWRSGKGTPYENMDWYQRCIRDGMPYHPFGVSIADWNAGLLANRADEQNKPTRTSRPKAKVEPRAIRGKHGYVYLMWSEDARLYKIGQSNNIASRLNGLNREIPVKVECIHWFECNDCLKCEKFLHEKFASERVKYEWFRLSPDQTEWIRSIKNYEIDELLAAE